MDVSAKRLAELAPRAARAGVTNVHPLVLSGEGDARARRLAGKIDRVLVDAPCSGFGTLRRNPDLKWRHGPQAIGELAAKQAGILQAAARLVKPGGRLVYATCSILPEENESRRTRNSRRCPAASCLARNASTWTAASACGSGLIATVATVSSPQLTSGDRNSLSGTGG
jgi:16S rRNA C967 or C1407 C5-methylase (RsmB/RsmF family)